MEKEMYNIQVWNNGQLVSALYSDIVAGNRFRMFNKEGKLIVLTSGQYEFEAGTDAFFDEETNQWMVEIFVDGDES